MWLLKWRSRIKTQAAILVTVPFENAMDQGIVAAEGRREDLLRIVTNLAFPRLLPSKTVYVSDDSSFNEDVKRRLAILGFKPHFVSYSDLGMMTGKDVSGRSVVLFSPVRALESGSTKGMVDGGLVRTLGNGLWRKIVVANESDQELVVGNIATFEEVSQTLTNRIPEAEFSKSWLYELLLTLLYRRHLTVPGLLRLASFSMWYGCKRSLSDVRIAVAELDRMRLVRQNRGRFTCTEYGRLTIDREIPFSKIDLDELQKWVETEIPQPEHYDELKSEREAYARDQILELVSRYGWTTVLGSARQLLDTNVTEALSLWKARGLLDELTAKGLLVKSTYVRGMGRPTYIYHEPESPFGEWIEDRCGDCVFFARPYRRCRLWSGVSRYGASGAYSRLGKLSPVGIERLRASNTRIGPKTTACEHFTPRRKDFPITRARERCLGCGTEIDSPVATIVRCSTCGTGYKPLSNRILVLYNYEHIFKAKYTEITGAAPPDKALSRHDLGDAGSAEWRDLIVLYPGETVRLGTDGMYLKREGTGVFQRYDRIYRAVDYGSLAPRQIRELEKKGVRVIQRALQEGEQSRFPLYPSSDFVTSLGWLNADRALAKLMTESLLLSVIVATKRIAELGGRLLRENVERQLMEYERMRCETNLSSTKMLAYEARVNNLYWKNYKTMLKAVGLDFRSRVRDRFVREFVQSIRARARGYSPANSAINYLHQRRLILCRRANALSGIGWIGSEGVVHFASRKPTIGLLLDLSDSFKLADREGFLKASLTSQITREDFVGKVGRQGLRFYYPTVNCIGKLETIGSEADNDVVNYQGGDLPLNVAYEKYVAAFVRAVSNRSLESFEPFIYARKAELDWVRTRGVGEPSPD